MDFDIEEELKNLPNKPGVYLMYDDSDTIIYIGKAINLKNRVRQYFKGEHEKKRSPKIEKMISQIKYFEFIITDTELEALILECNLIKEHMPKYNTMLKDGKTYPYIKITTNEDFPRIIIARQVKKDNAKYFGPYTGIGNINNLIEIIRKVYFIRTCNKNLPKDIGKSRPCLYYDIKQCQAPCNGLISKEDYQKCINEVIEFLNGNYSKISKLLEDKMMLASKNLEFEQAIEYRNLLNNVKAIAQKQKIIDTKMNERDIIAFAKAGDEVVIQIFFIRNGKLIAREHYYMTNVYQSSHEEIMTNFIKQFYSGTPYIPKELLLQYDIEDKEIISEWLSNIRGSKVNISIPKIGQKEKLIELAEKNASIILQKDAQKIQREQKRTLGALHELETYLELKNIKRIEAFDISNISGFNSVGSMVVYESGKPKRNDYRKFKIQTVKGADDYKSMYEVLKRRFLHGINENSQGINGKFNCFPDLIMMDGGKGQVNIALSVMKELNLDIPICGMVKDDNHRTKGLYFNNLEIPINTSSEAFKLITRIQNETHRFAIEYHKTLRSKTQVSSILDDIEGIGKSRRLALIQHFKSIDAIKNATIDQLLEVPSMTQKSAENVYKFFH